MYKYLIMLILCLAAQIALGKSLFDYNVNPEYDLLAEESKSYSNFWQGSAINSPTHKRYKHHAKPGHGRGYGNSGYGGHPGHSFDYHDHDHHHFPQSFEEYGDHSDYDYPQHHHPHGFPPGQAKKHGHGGLPPGQAKKPGGNGHPHDSKYIDYADFNDEPGIFTYGPDYFQCLSDPPRRFPPPPVYDKDFIDPWATTPQPFIVQQPPLTTPAVYVAPRLTSRATTPAVYVAPRLTSTTTTPTPPSSTISDDQLMYDIDVRFGRD